MHPGSLQALVFLFNPKSKIDSKLLDHSIRPRVHLDWYCQTKFVFPPQGYNNNEFKLGRLLDR
jgi:hypothetical protein